MGEAPGLRAARPDDAPALAELVNFAGEGLPLYLWGKMAEAGQTAWDVGRIRAARDDGAFSWRSAVVAEQDGTVAACLMAICCPRPRRRSTDGQGRLGRAGRRVGSAGQGAAGGHMRGCILTDCSSRRRSRVRCRR